MLETIQTAILIDFEILEVQEDLVTTIINLVWSLVYRIIITQDIVWG